MTMILIITIKQNFNNSNINYKNDNNNGFRISVMIQ